MPSSHFCRSVGLAIKLAPLALLLVAISAGPLGLDPDNNWGAIRIGTFLLGAFGSIAVVGWRIVRILEARDPEMDESRRHGLEESSEVDGPPHQPLQRAEWGGRVWRWLVPLILAIELLYVFIGSAGHWHPWPETTHYYDLLAGGFAEGKLSLSVAPDPRLAQLENPYSLAERGSIPVLTDASYYKGNYYLYWGPVPAGLIALLKLALGLSVGDQYVVIAALNGILLFSVLIFLELKRMYERPVPAWLLAGSILLVATAHPVLWVLSWPSIYAAAIASGQMFLLAGLYFALPLLKGQETGAGRPLLAGSLWALALGSRLALFVAVAVLMSVIAFNLLRQRMRHARFSDAAVRILLLGLPVAVGLGLLAWYNLIRFDSPLETGLHYQLSVLDLRPELEAASIFDVRYLVSNAVYYLATPLRFRSAFPFIRPFFEQIPLVAALADRFGVPADHHVENIAGLLFTVPAITLLGVFGRDLLCRPSGSPGATNHRTAGPPDRGEISPFERVVLVLFLVAVCGSIPTLMYFWITNRFLLDSVPLLAIASAASGWHIYSSRASLTLHRYYLAFVMTSLVAIGFIVSLLLAMTGTASRLDDVNPELWNALDRLFSR